MSMSASREKGKWLAQFFGGEKVPNSVQLFIHIRCCSTFRMDSCLIFVVSPNFEEDADTLQITIFCAVLHGLLYDIMIKAISLAQRDVD